MRIIATARRMAVRWWTSPATDHGTIGYEAFRSLSVTKLRATLAGDPTEAARWMRAGALHGFADAQLMFGQMLLDGICVARDPDAAFRWFHHAAKSGLPEAMNMAGRCLELGWGTLPDPAHAARWYRRAAERGLDWAQYNFANLLLRGDGIARDPSAALVWYHRAAAQGHAKSMNQIGRFLEEGWQGPPDPVRAASWYRAAAEAGDYRGQFNYATVLADSRRIDEASRWFRAAIASGSRDFLLAAERWLAARPEPELRALGWIAFARRESTHPEKA